MPYRLTLQPIEERSAELEAMLRGEPLAFKTNEPARLRYRLHEALHAARVLGIEPYASLQVRIRVRSPFVYVTPVHVIHVEQTQSTLPQGEAVEFAEVRNALDAIATLRARPDLMELHFPAFEDDLEPVELWASARGYEIAMEPHLILRRHNVGS